MRFFAVVVVSGIGLVAACGGAIEGQNDPCPSELAGACAAGARCARRASTCDGSSETETCSCVDGGWRCPGRPLCAPVPSECNGPNGVSPGSACSVKGATCHSNEPLRCTDVPPPCTCDGSVWRCTSFTCPSCPSPSQVKHGAKCSETVFNCPGTSECGSVSSPASCSCSGGMWYCAPSPKCWDAG